MDPGQLPAAPFFDGSLLDICTLVVALLAMLVRPIRRLFSGRKPCFTLRDCAIDFLNGSVVVPFMVLVMAVSSRQILEEALKANKVSLALAGVIGLLFVVREIFVGDDTNNNGRNSHWQ